MPNDKLREAYKVLLKDKLVEMVQSRKHMHRQLRRNTWRYICKHLEPITWADYKLLEEDI